MDFLLNGWGASSDRFFEFLRIFSIEQVPANFN